MTHRANPLPRRRTTGRRSRLERLLLGRHASADDALLRLYRALGLGRAGVSVHAFLAAPWWHLRRTGNDPSLATRAPARGPLPGGSP